MGKIKHYIGVFATVIVLTAVVYIGLISIYKLPVAASAQAGPIDTMFSVHFMLIAFLFALIMAFMLYSIVFFRRKPGDEEDGPHIHGNTALEIAWTVIPLIVVIIFGIWAVGVFADLIRPNPDEMVVKVTGQQWSWTFEYPEQGGFSSNELYLPVDQPILLEMGSTDVIHSFWVPEFRVKQDLVPGYTTKLRITPTEIGEYRVVCAEICGGAHSQMTAPVIVMNTTAFESWAEERASGPAYGDMTAEERGEIWYTTQGCAGCHSVDGSALVGPTWQGVYGREEELESGETVTVNDEYIRHSILDPNDDIVAGYVPSMPDNYGDQFATLEAEILESDGVEIDMIADIIAFMQTLEE